MTWHNKVVWTEGMFLQPQHFQQQDRFVSRLVDARVGLAAPHAWGFASLVLDKPALRQGQVAVSAARGVLPDGTPFDIPDHDAAPPALSIPADARDEPLLLVASLARPGVAESDVEVTAPSMPPRFQALDVEVADTNSASRQAPLQVGRLNLRLMLARDANEGFTTLGVARILELKSDGSVTLDTQFIAPTLHATGNATLEEYLRDAYGMVRQRAEALAARLGQPNRAGVGEIADFVFLQALNRIEPLLAHLQKLPLLHPERLYAELVQIAGELSTFRDRKRPLDYPPYHHPEPAACFRDVMADLRESLAMVLDRSAIPIDLQERANGFRVAIIGDVDLQRTARFVLAVNAQMPSEALRLRFPTQVKIGPAERIRDLVTSQVPGVTVSPMPVAPRQIPYHGGFTYFELDTRGNEMWRQLERSAGLAMHVSGDFPGLEMEFWAIRA